MYVWERGGHRDVALWAHHSMAGGTHATKLLEAVGAVSNAEQELLRREASAAYEIRR